MSAIPKPKKHDWKPVKVDMANLMLTKIEFMLPIRIESELNRRDHWAVRRKRFQAHKEAVHYGWPRGAVVELPAVIVLTRIAPRKIIDGHDNLRSGFKATVDALAKRIGVDDGDSRVTWIYAQEKGPAKCYAVRVTIEVTRGR